jgi:hypothetical protein
VQLYSQPSICCNSLFYLQDSRVIKVVPYTPQVLVPCLIFTSVVGFYKVCGYSLMVKFVLQFTIRVILSLKLEEVVKRLRLVMLFGSGC